MRGAGRASNTIGDLPLGRPVPADPLFALKTRILAARHWLLTPLREDRPARPRYGRHDDVAPCVLGSDSSALFTATDPREFDLELGKIENLRVAARRLNGLELNKGDVFGFWRCIGRPTRRKGYVVGRELRQGCLVPTIAGGICQLTNAISRTAIHAGMEMIERHRHSAAVADLVFDPETDATVFWNYIDLRFRAPRPIRLAVFLTTETLEVRIEGRP